MIAAVLIFVAGYFSMLTLVAVGFVSFGMIFMAMMGVLPSSSAHPSEPAEPKPIKMKEPKKQRRVFTQTILPHGRSRKFLKDFKKEA